MKYSIRSILYFLIPISLAFALVTSLVRLNKQHRLLESYGVIRASADADRLELIQIGPSLRTDDDETPSHIFRVQNHAKYKLHAVVYDGTSRTSKVHELLLDYPEYAITYVAREKRIWVQSTNGPLNRNDFRFDSPGGKFDAVFPGSTRRAVNVGPFHVMVFDDATFADTSHDFDIALEGWLELADERQCQIVIFRILSR